MAFENEYISPLELEDADFFKRARETLRTGHHRTDAWTVDRTNNRVLFRTGCGHDIDTHSEEYWEYLDGDLRYSFTTQKLQRCVVSQGPPKVVTMTRDIVHFWGGKSYSGLPSMEIAQRIKAAFDVHGAYCMVSRGERVQHNLLWQGEAI